MNKVRYTLNLKTSRKVRELLMRRFNQQKLLYKDVIADAEALGKKIDKAAFSRFFKQDEKGRYTMEQRGSLSEETIAWLCIRWGIRGQLVLDLLPYEKETCLESLKKFREHE